MSHKFPKSLVLSYLFLYAHWVELPGISIGIGHHNQDSWYRSSIIYNIKSSLGIGIARNEKSRHPLFSDFHGAFCTPRSKGGLHLKKLVRKS